MLMIGCYEAPDYSGTRFKCDSTHACPDGQQCVSGSCSGGSGTDASVSSTGVLCGSITCGATQKCCADLAAGVNSCIALAVTCAGYAATCRAIRDVDWLDRLASIRCPTLVIAGREDVGAPVAMSEAMQQRIPGAELVVIEDAAHLSVVEQPAAFGAAIDRFLARVGGAGAR